MENPGYVTEETEPVKEKDPDILAEHNSIPIVDNTANAKKEKEEKEKDPNNYVAHISEVTLENPIFDPDGVPYERMEDTQDFPDPASLPIKMVVRRRNKITCMCFAMVTVLLIILAGIGVGIYYVLDLRSHSPVKRVEYDTTSIESSFRILNRPYMPSYSSVQSTEFYYMSRNITRRLDAIFLKEDLYNQLKDLYVTKLLNGSVIVKNVYLFNNSFTSKSLEKQVESIFVKNLQKREENGKNNYYLDIYLVDYESITFTAMGLGQEPPRPWKEKPVESKTTTPMTTTTRTTPTTTTTTTPVTTITTTKLDKDLTTEFESTVGPKSTAGLESPDGPDSTAVVESTAGHESKATSESTATVEITPEATSSPALSTISTTPSITSTTTITTTTTTTPYIDRCEEITVSECRVSTVPYQVTHFPNLIGQSSQADAEHEIQNHLSAVLNSGCHPNAARFVCGLLTPKCTDTGPGVIDMVPPCRQFCEEFFSRCNTFFPTSLLGLDCAIFPNNTNGEDLCVDAPKMKPYTVRLAGGTSEYDGRVEIFHQGSWGTICDHGWTNIDAQVVCRQLGFQGVGLARTGAYFGEGAESSKVWLSNFNCLGTENHLALCQHHDWGDNICPHRNDAGVICDAENRDVSGVKVRLVGGTEGPWEGRLEVRYNDEWGTVCDDNFGKLEADVVCRMLGFNSSVKVAGLTDRYDVGEGRIWLDGLSCNGDEINIALCDHEGWGIHNCAHFEDVAVICQSPPSANPTPSPALPTTTVMPPVQVRLMEGPDATKGRVEVKYNGTWGTVCKSMFNNDAAVVICRMLGFNTEDANYQQSRYGSGIGTIWLDQLLCTGQEATIERCNHAPWGQNECSHLEDVSISCQGKKSEVTTSKPTTVRTTTAVYIPTIEKVRLVGGPRNSTGRLEVFYDKSWGTICDDGFDDNDATVFCRMMGYRKGISQTHKYGPGVGMIWMEDIGCRGNESSAMDCFYLGLEKNVVNCGHHEDISISCEEEVIRISRGSFPDEGILEVFYNDTWGTVCSDGFNDTDAHAACHTIGYRSKKSRVLIRSTWGAGRPIWLSEVNCSVGEEDFFRCGHTGWGVNQCSDYDNVYINCNAVDAPIRLADGSNALEGRLEVFHDNVWGTICDDGFDDVDAGVVCRSLGFSFDGASSPSIPSHKEGTGQIWLENLRCSGTEIHITDCRHDGWGDHNCEHDEDVYIRCQNAPTPTPPPVCEELSMQTCAGHVSYSRTSFPNWLGHMSQSETNSYVTGTWKLALSSGCSPLALPFVCATYTPKCPGKILPPCREVCQEVRRSCGGMLFTGWPPELYCEDWPSLEGGGDCLSLGFIIPQDRCEDLDIGLCRNVVNYNRTAFPNWLGQVTQAEARAHIDGAWATALVTTCSEFTVDFICATYAPRCPGERLPPCKEVCMDVLKRCGGKMKWPKEIDCNAWPTLSQGTCLSFGYMVNPTVTTPTRRFTIRTSIIHTGGVRPTPPVVPLMNKTTSAESTAEAQTLKTTTPGKPVTKLNTAKLVKTTVLMNGTTSLNATPINTTPRITQPKTTTSKRSTIAVYNTPSITSKDNMATTLLTPHSSDSTNISTITATFSEPGNISKNENMTSAASSSPISSTKSFPTTPKPSTTIPDTTGATCVEMTLTMCTRHVSYNRTAVPNWVGDMTQAEAHQQMEGKWQLPLSLACHVKLLDFVCAVYAPQCMTRKIPPCREVCLQVRKSCSDLIHHGWPAKLDCGSLPKNTEAPCLSFDDTPLVTGTPTSKNPTENSTEGNTIPSPINIPSTTPPNEPARNVTENSHLVSEGTTVYPETSLIESTKNPYTARTSKDEKQENTTSIPQTDKEKMTTHNARSTSFKPEVAKSYSTSKPKTPETTGAVCVEMTLTMCTRYVTYNRTSIPNWLGGVSQGKAHHEIEGRWQLAISFLCHPKILDFLCAIYAPRCLAKKIPPCQEICLEVQNSCWSFVNGWPAELNCGSWPKKTEGHCLSFDTLSPAAKTTVVIRSRTTTTKKTSMPSEGESLPTTLVVPLTSSPSELALEVTDDNRGVSKTSPSGSSELPYILETSIRPLAEEQEKTTSVPQNVMGRKTTKFPYSSSYKAVSIASTDIGAIIPDYPANEAGTERSSAPFTPWPVTESTRDNLASDTYSNTPTKIRQTDITESKHVTHPLITDKFTTRQHPNYTEPYKNIGNPSLTTETSNVITSPPLASQTTGQFVSKGGPPVITMNTTAELSNEPEPTDSSKESELNNAPPKIGSTKASDMTTSDIGGPADDDLNSTRAKNINFSTTTVKDDQSVSIREHNAQGHTSDHAYTSTSPKNDRNSDAQSGANTLSSATYYLPHTTPFRGTQKEVEVGDSTAMGESTVKPTKSTELPAEQVTLKVTSQTIAKTNLPASSSVPSSSETPVTPQDDGALDSIKSSNNQASSSSPMQTLNNGPTTHGILRNDVSDADSVRHTATALPGADTVTCMPYGEKFPICHQVAKYNYTSFPNAFNHTSLEQAEKESAYIWNLRHADCHPHEEAFVCAVVIPQCLSIDGVDSVVWPCKSYCQEVQTSCLPLLRQIGFLWPAEVNCDDYIDEEPCFKPSD